MTMATGIRRTGAGEGAITVLALGAGLLAAGGAAAAVLLAGPIALLAAVPVAGLAALVWPRASFWSLLAVGALIDPRNTEITGSLAGYLWEFPPSIKNQLPLTVNPFELALVGVSLAVLLRVPRARGKGLPVLTLAIPLVMLFGVIHGKGAGGPGNLIYHELRGLIFGAFAFAAAWRIAPHDGRRHALIAAMCGLGGLSVLTIARYVLTLSRGSGIPMEYWFAHETGLFLGVGVVAGCLLVIRQKHVPHRFPLLVLTIVMALALMMTGRRSGILAVGVGLLLTAWLLMPKRPLLLVAVAVPTLVASSAYLAIYWEGHTGPLAEPARAIRSQFDPSARDQSSDVYRVKERENLVRTIDQDPVSGIGFGRPYTQYVKLPVLDFWSLQFYTPHQGILWLWLKMGLAGLVAFVGTWAIALGRCIRVTREQHRSRPLPIGPMLLAATLVMYLAYARIDLALVGSRASVPLAVAMALALSLTPGRRVGEEPGLGH